MELFFYRIKMPALHVAAYFGNVEVLQQRLLTDDPNMRSMNNTTALMSALFKRQKEAFQILIEHGADPNLLNDDGHDILSLIMTHNNEPSDWIGFAIQKGAIPHPVRHKGLLVWVIRNHTLAMMERILRVSPYMVDDTDEHDQTPLHIVLGHISSAPLKEIMVHLLLRHGADVTRKDNIGLSPRDILDQRIHNAVSRKDTLQQKRLQKFSRRFQQQENAVWLYSVARVLQDTKRPQEFQAVACLSTPFVLQHVVCVMNPSLIQELSRML